MHWESPTQINIYFNLNASNDEPGEVRKAVVKRMAHIHPDNNGQGFPNPEVETEWHELQSAKEFIDAMSNDSQLVPLSQVMSLVKAVGQGALVPIDSRISSLKQEARKVAQDRNYFPRISSGAIAAICGFLFTFSNTVKDHPLLGEWVNTTIGQIVLLIMTFYAGIFFLMTWARERRLESKVEYLSSEEAGREILSKILRNRKDREGNSRRFTQRDLVRNLDQRDLLASTAPSALLFGSGRLTPTMAERIVGIQIDRLTTRGVIVELPQKGLNRMFEISKAAAEELKNLSDG